MRVDVPFSRLTQAERHIVFEGESVKRQILYPSKNGKLFELNFTYRNARLAVHEALKNAETERGLERVDRFLSVQQCPACRGTRLSEQVLATQVAGINLAEATAKTLTELTAWVETLSVTMPRPFVTMARSIVSQMVETAARLLELGLGYLTLDRASATLSTGERQRVQLARAVRNRTIGVLYVLDEPSIGMHPSNVDGLLAVMRNLLDDGNSVVVVDHDVQVLRQADWLIEIGPDSGAKGGTVLASGTVAQISSSKVSRIGWLK